MNRVLLGALAASAVFALTSFAFHSAVPRTALTGGAWRVSDYQLDRAFRIALPNAQTITVNTVQMPLTGGLIITQVSGGGCAIAVNGASESVAGGPGGSANTLNPPIIARPGDTLTITYAGQSTIAGYTTMPGET